MGSYSGLLERGELTAESRRLIDYFVQDTTDKIFYRMSKMDIHSPALKHSIRAVVYNNAGGDSAMVRFYWLNFGRFLELGVGRYSSDYDLGGEGVKVRNIDIPELTRSYEPLSPEFKDTTDRGIKVGDTGRNKYGKPVEREKFHRARPFFTNTIRQHTKRIAERLAIQQGYTHTVRLMQGIISTVCMEEVDREWRRNAGYLETARAEMGALQIDSVTRMEMGLE